MIEIQGVVVDALWLFGIVCLVATLSYMVWYSRVRGWHIGSTLRLPRTLVPMCVSLEFFCIGMAMKGVVAFKPAPWWEIVAWSILAVLFAVQTVVYGIAGMRYGWDTPIEGRKNGGY